MQVFLSYAHTPADERIAFYIESRLRAAGVGVWMDKSSLNAGQPTRQAIQDAGMPPPSAKGYEVLEHRTVSN